MNEGTELDLSAGNLKVCRAACGLSIASRLSTEKDAEGVLTKAVICQKKIALKK